MDKIKIIELITNAIGELVKKDNDIFKQQLPKLGKSSKKERLLNRELHETTLNHRFAFYLENGLIKEKITNYHVDIEYNRNFYDQKRCRIGKFRIPIRPDILIHKRMNTSADIPHLLVVEAKKDKTKEYDIVKVKCFIEDEQYHYKFGLTISYAYDSTKVKAVLYYKDENNKLKTENIEVARINKTSP